MSEHALIEEIACDSAREFCNAIAPIGPVFSRFSRVETWVYRGHGSADYKLVPSAYRPDGRRKLFEISLSGFRLEDARDSAALQWLIEAASIQHFFYRADQAGLPFPEDSQLTRRQLAYCVDTFRRWAHESREPHDVGHILRARNEPTHDWIPETLLSFVAIAQHHGIPTRLLDWSFSPFVAAYFAATNALDCDSDRFSIHALFASGLSIGDQLRSVVERRDLNLTLVTAPRAANPNLHAQEGIFSYLTSHPALPSAECQRFILDDELAALENPAAQYGPLLYKITLAHEHAPEVLWFLDKMGYNAARIFPGFEGSARAVCEFSRMSPPAGALRKRRIWGQSGPGGTP